MSNPITESPKRAAPADDADDNDNDSHSDKRVRSDDDEATDSQESLDSCEDGVWACVACGINQREENMVTTSLDVDGYAVRTCKSCAPASDYCGHCMQRFLQPGQTWETPRDGDLPDWRCSVPAGDIARSVAQDSANNLHISVAMHTYYENFYHADDCMARCTWCGHEAPVARPREIVMPDDHRDRRIRKFDRTIHAALLVCRDAAACRERKRQQNTAPTK